MFSIELWHCYQRIMLGQDKENMIAPIKNMERHNCRIGQGLLADRYLSSAPQSQFPPRLECLWDKNEDPQRARFFMISYSSKIWRVFHSRFFYIMLYYEDRTVQKSARQLQRMLLKKARCRYESRLSLRPNDLILQREVIWMNDV